MAASSAAAGGGEGVGGDLERAAALAMPVKDLNEKWKLLPSFLKVRGLVKQHIESFDHFVEHDLPEIVEANSTVRSEVDPEFLVVFKSVRVGQPKVYTADTDDPVTPHECRLRDLTYSAPIFATMEYTVQENGLTRKMQSEEQIGSLPIMLGSKHCYLRGKSRAELAALKECPYDPGGYFVIKGVERVVLVQEQLSKNRVIVEMDARGGVMASVTSSTAERKSRTAVASRGTRLHLQNNLMGDDVPVVVVFKAMGVVSEMEIAALVGADMAEALGPSLEEARELSIFTQKQALEYLGTRIKGSRSHGGGARSLMAREEEARNVLATVVLSHIDVTGFDYGPKAVFLAYMVRRVLLTAKGAVGLDDKDYYGNKRLELAGQLISLLFEDAFKRFQDNMRRHVDSTLNKRSRVGPVKATQFLQKNIIRDALVQALATGNWSLRRFRMDRAGITQQLSRLSYISSLGMMTRINSQFEKTRKVAGPRALQPSQWGMVCPSDTPEGEACGLVKNLALLTHVTVDADDGPVTRLCVDLGVEDCGGLMGEELNAGAFLIFVNGRILGCHRRPHVLAHRVRTARRQGILSEHVSVYVHAELRAVHVATDGGRVCRPLILVDPVTKAPRVTKHHITALRRGLMDFNELLSAACVEYVDVNEENNTLVALRDEDIGPDTTHVEIDPLTILGVVAGLIPYPHHNQSPRNTYQCAMGKQAIGTPGLNQFERVDTVLYTLVYPHKPLVKTRVLDLIHFDDVPAGQNAVVAVMSYSGYDIEDAVVLNRASLDRGFGRCFVFKKFVVNLRRHPNSTMDRLAGPADDKASAVTAEAQEQQRALGEEGIVGVGEAVRSQDVLVRRQVPQNVSDKVEDPGVVDHWRNAFARFKGPKDVPSLIDKVLVASDAECAGKVIKILTRQCRRPEIGDKFSSRHGQKGVCGLIVPQEDLPFDSSGIVPDLIMNPHGFPSRMTIGKMIEMVGGKAALMDGERRDGTAFAGDSPESIGKALIKAGYHYGGKDLLYSGTTGVPIRAFIFFGPIYYQKLKHMVLDKIHGRARGPRAGLTRQPTEGRSRDGGLRLGEMERDALVGYGSSMLLLERLMISSDVYEAEVCCGPKCGGLLGWDGWCKYCGTGEHIRKARLPYACKLLFQELQAMNIVPRIKLSDL